MKMSTMSLEPVTFDFDLRCTPAEAFDAFAVHMGDWWDGQYSADPTTFTGVDIDPRPGGQVLLVHSNGRRDPFGTVLVWEPGRRYAQTSTLAQRADFPSRISVLFAPARSGCRCHFEHGGWIAANGEFRPKFGDWPQLLSRFSRFANGSAS